MLLKLIMRLDFFLHTALFFRTPLFKTEFQQPEAYFLNPSSTIQPYCDRANDVKENECWIICIWAFLRYIFSQSLTKKMKLAGLSLEIEASMLQKLCSILPNGVRIRHRR